MLTSRKMKGHACRLVFVVAVLALSTAPFARAATKTVIKTLPRPRKVHPGNTGHLPAPKGREDADVETPPPPPSPPPTPPPSPPPPQPPSPPPPPPPSPPPPPPPSPPPPLPPPPSGCPHTPVVAYCLPFVDGERTGCLLKVAKADAGSSLVFKLDSPAGERVASKAQLDKDKTVWHELYYLPHSERSLSKLPGTVQYQEAPECTWPLSAEDPTVKKVFVSIYFTVTHTSPRRLYDWVVPVGDGQTVTLHTPLDPGR